VAVPLLQDAEDVARDIYNKVVAEMKIRRYIVTVALEDCVAKKLTLGTMEGAVQEGILTLDFEGVAEDIGISLADERVVNIADPDVDDREAYENWVKRAEEEVYK